MSNYVNRDTNSWAFPTSPSYTSFVPPTSASVTSPTLNFSAQKFSPSLPPFSPHQQQLSINVRSLSLDRFPPPFPEVAGLSATGASSSSASSAIPPIRSYSPSFIIPPSQAMSSHAATGASSSSASSAIPPIHSYPPSFIIPPSQAMLSHAATGASSSSASSAIPALSLLNATPVGDPIEPNRDFNPSPFQESSQNTNKRGNSNPQSSNRTKKSKLNGPPEIDKTGQTKRQIRNKIEVEKTRELFNDLAKSISFPDFERSSRISILSMALKKIENLKKEVDRLSKENEKLKIKVQAVESFTASVKILLKD